MPLLLDREQPPLVGDSLQSVRTAIGELDSGTGYEVPDCAGHQHFVRVRSRCNPRADVYRDSAYVVADQLTFTGMQPGAHLEAQSLHSLADCARTSDRARRTVERGQQPVARGVDFAPAVCDR
jgi:hypothetical protein